MQAFAGRRPNPALDHTRGAPPGRIGTLFASARSSRFVPGARCGLRAIRISGSSLPKTGLRSARRPDRRSTALRPARGHGRRSGGQAAPMPCRARPLMKSLATWLMVGFSITCDRPKQVPVVGMHQSICLRPGPAPRCRPTCLARARTRIQQPCAAYRLRILVHGATPDGDQSSLLRGRDAVGTRHSKSVRSEFPCDQLAIALQ